MVRRSFTIVETVLAATLSSLVVLGCMTAFMAINRTDRALTARFEEANDLARIQRTMQRAFSSLLMAEESPLDEELDGEELDEANAADPALPVEDENADEDLEPETVFYPRILLAQDQDPTLTSLLTRSQFSQGAGTSATPQRLELVLSAVPLRPSAGQSVAWTQVLAGVDDVPTDEDGDATVEVEDYAGVRGAFVLRPDGVDTVGAQIREKRGDERIGWTLWWQPLDTRSEPARVASGLAACNFQMFYDRQFNPELVAYSPDEMPTYIQLEVETLSGLYANYLFEVVWSVDQLEDEEEEETASGAGGGGGGGQAAQGGGGGPGGGGPGGGGFQGGPGGGGDGFRGGRGGRRGQDGVDPRARPRPNMPQGANRGQFLEGQGRGRQMPPGFTPGEGGQGQFPGRGRFQGGGQGGGGQGGGGQGGGGRNGGAGG